MVERCVCRDYKVTIKGGGTPFDMEFEIWTESELREPNFFVIFGGVEQDLDQFTPTQLKAMAQYVEDWRAPGGR